MSVLLKNKETLTQLFATFSLQEVLVVNQNLNATLHLLASPPAQLLLAMKEKKVNIDQFLGKKCLPLVRFYLADRGLQKETFLSTGLLSELFVSLPAVEAFIFKGQIHSAQLAVQHASRALSSLLVDGGIAQKVDGREPVIQLSGFQSLNKSNITPSLSQLAEAKKQYINCFYYLQAGELLIVKEGESIDANMLLYSELSPLQQLKAQTLFKLSCKKKPVESMAQQSVSA